MSATHSHRPSPALVVAIISLFVALGGTAVALDGRNTVDSGDIINSEVKTKDIRDGHVRSDDLGADAVTGSKILDGSVHGSDVADATLTGANIVESTLDPSSFVTGRTFRTAADCNADLASQVCASTTVTLARDSRVLYSAAGNWRTFNFDDNAPPGTVDNVDESFGTCSVFRDPGGGAGLGSSDIFMGERRVIAGAGSSGGGTFSVTRVSEAVIPAGTYAFQLQCDELDGDIDFDNTMITAVVIGAREPD